MKVSSNNLMSYTHLERRGDNLSYLEDANIISIRIIKRLFKEDTEEEIEKKAKKILSIANSIGADYSESTLTKIAKSFYKRD